MQGLLIVFKGLAFLLMVWGMAIIFLGEMGF